MLAQLAKKLTNTNKVCTAGGSFLNCNSNEQIIKSGLFEKSFFIPPADDSGIPLGCAWYAYTQVGDVEKVDMIKPYLGRSYNDEDIESALSKHDNLVVDRYENIEDLISVVTEKLVNNRVIGWFQGGAELGPRALGNRSILASPKLSG